MNAFYRAIQLNALAVVVATSCGCLPHTPGGDCGNSLSAQFFHSSEKNAVTLLRSGEKAAAEFILSGQPTQNVGLFSFWGAIDPNVTLGLALYEGSSASDPQAGSLLSFDTSVDFNPPDPNVPVIPAATTDPNALAQAISFPTMGSLKASVPYWVILLPSGDGNASIGISTTDHYNGSYSVYSHGAWTTNANALFAFDAYYRVGCD